ncbi:MAG TPA: hypothetical protein PLR24_11530, partial [Saprospiraceae bacterium]|nr:hypothetical protein [Saprospiraceae bacterium]
MSHLHHKQVLISFYPCKKDKQDKFPSEHYQYHLEKLSKELLLDSLSQSLLLLISLEKFLHKR